MKERHPGESDWQVFLALARAEGWRVPAGEPDLIREAFPGGAFALVREGRPVGFVTAVGHGRSGWIGNLVVAPQYRGLGLGSRLFDRGLATLERRGATEVWLTASEQGRPLYERRGFRSAGEVRRWVRPALGGEDGAESPAGLEGLEALLQADRKAWGESRRTLLEGLARGGRVFTAGETAALLQAGPGVRVLGPWYSPGLCPRENRLLLSAILEATAAEIVLDVPSASPLGHLLAAAGLEEAGGSLLMVRGEGVAPLSPGLVSLASLGSLG